MIYRVLNQSDLIDLHALWNAYTRDDHVLYKSMTMDDISHKFLFNKDHETATIGAFEAQQLIGFASGNRSKNGVVGYITFVYVKEAYRRSGVGTKLLNQLEKQLTSEQVARLDVLFFNPANLEWIIPGTGWRDHPNAPGVDMASGAYRFFEHRGYHMFAQQNSYYREITDYDYSSRIKKKIDALHVQGVYVTYYDPSKHVGWDALLDDLNNDLWRQEIKANIQRDDADPLLIVTKDGIIGGFAGPLRRQESMRGYFSGIGIHTDFRGFGAGSVLFAALCKGLRDIGATYMTLFTGETNPARHIYEKEGFNIVRSWANMRKLVKQ